MINLPSDEDLEIRQRRLAAVWESYSRDTPPDIDRRRLASAWNAPAWRKLWMAAEMFQAARDLTLAGLRHRHPDADEQELRLRLASLLFGPQIAHDLCTQEHQEKNSDAA
jgi:hypothetical protein